MYILINFNLSRLIVIYYKSYATDKAHTMLPSIISKITVVQ